MCPLSSNCSLVEFWIFAGPHSDQTLWVNWNWGFGQPMSSVQNFGPKCLVIHKTFSGNTCMLLNGGSLLADIQTKHFWLIKIEALASQSLLFRTLGLNVLSYVKLFLTYCMSTFFKLCSGNTHAVELWVICQLNTPRPCIGYGTET